MNIQYPHIQSSPAINYCNGILSDLVRTAIAVVFAWCVLPGLVPAASAQVGNVVTMAETGPSGRRVDIVILGDGFRIKEMGQFANAAQEFIDTFFSFEPYAKYRSFFNVKRIETPSVVSGAGQNGTGINTVFGSFYDCDPLIPHLICVDESAVNSVLADNGFILPDRDIVIVIVNDAEYGGSGAINQAVTSLNPAGLEIAIHEIGHSFAQLKDEYDNNPASCLNAVSSANTTEQPLAANSPWAHWYPAGTTNPVPDLDNPADTELTIGHFEGANGCATDRYRPTLNSMMRSNGRPLGNVNSEKIIQRFYNIIFLPEEVEVSADLQTEFQMDYFPGTHEIGRASCRERV